MIVRPSPSHEEESTVPRQMRRAQYQMDDDDARRVLTESEYGFLGTVGEDGVPYVVPVNYCYHKGNIVFHTAREGHKIENIRHNPQVCFTVCTNVELVPERFTTRYESVIVFGRARIVEDVEVKRELLSALVRRLAPGRAFPCPDSELDTTGVVCITPEHMTGKKRTGLK